MPVAPSNFYPHVVAHDFNLWEPVGMVRVLKDVTYMQGVPASGRCSECDRPFSTSPEAMGNPERATRDFFRAFKVHKCEVDASKDEETKD
jgi:hypothetical protein